MSGVEAAASLFGSEEPDSDPFAALGAEAPQRSGDELFANHDAVSSSPEFLKPTQDDGHLFNSEATAQDALQFHAQPEPTSNHSPSSTYLASGGTSQQEWYDQTGQMQEHGSSSNTSTVTSPLQQYSTGDALHSNFAASNSYVTPATSSGPTPVQSPYNPYIPSQSTSNHLPSRPLTSSASSYNSYAYTPPSQYEPLSQLNPPYANNGQTVHAVPAQATQPIPTAPALTSPLPPPPTTTVVRPKVSNAYDPPFPTTTKTNRRTGRAASGQNSYGYSAYGNTPALPQNTSNTPQPPPPPPPQRLPPPMPPQSMSASSPPARSPSLPVQPTYGGYTNSVLGIPAASDVVPQGNGLYEAEAPVTHQEVVSTWSKQSLGAASQSPSKIHESVSEQGTAPDSSHLATPYTNSFASPLAAGPVNELSPPDSASSPASLRAKSPHEHALPPSPTPSQTGRSSSFVDINMKRTLSPKPVELLRGKTPDLSQHSHREGTIAARPYHHVHSSPLRSSSPSQVPTTAARSPQTGMANPYLPKLANGEERSTSPTALQNNDSYAPNTHANGYKGERTASPNSFATVTAAGHPTKGHPANSYAPTNTVVRNRSMSNGSILPSTSTSTEDPYIPRLSATRTSIEADHSSHPPRYPYSNGYDVTTHPPLAPEHHAQEVLLKPFQTPYAPSPSLLGSNDPLGRTARRPIFSFGFGGKLVTCFHGADSLNTGFDVALSARHSTGVHIRILKKLIPDSALDTSTVLFPGPLYGDSATLATSLVRSGPTSQAKTKKANVIKYLSERTDELALGLRYLNPNSIESLRAEGKVVLVKLLQLMVEHDGRLTGTPELDTAVRLALVPRLEGTFGTNNFTTVADAQGSTNPGFSNDVHEPAVSVTTLRQSNLDKLQDFLLRGERRQAYHYALDEKLWAHAMIISSSIDKEAWKEVVNEFVRQELGASTNLSSASGRESLRVAYSLYSGQGATAVQELVPQNLLTRTTGRLQPSTLPHLTPKTPNFATVPTTPSSIPLETLSKWTDTLAMMLSNPLPQDTPAALTALGDQLTMNELHEAAHVCYLLAPQTSPLGGIGHPSARIILVGSRNPQNYPSFSKDQDPIIFSEVVEFALSLSPPAKGQDAFPGLPHLQAYRFIRAMSLVELGEIQQANKYCDAITASLNRGSPYVTLALVEQLKGLSDRIAGVTHVDKSFWTGAKLSKPSLDSIGGWLEGRFTKLVTGGDTDMDKLPEEETSTRKEPVFAGPFSHYSTISSTTPSARSSPQPQVMNANVLPPIRSGSAMAGTSSYTYQPTDRASSAMDHVRRKPSPAPRIASANASTTSFAPSFSQTYENQRDYSGYSASDDLVTPRPSLTSDDESKVHHASWWNGTAYAEGPSTQTPTAPAFMRVDENTIPAPSSSDGFISLADSTPYTIGSQSLHEPLSPTPELDQEDEEDLGFGNSKKDKAEKSKVHETSGEQMARQSSEQTAPSQSDKPTAVQPGWFSRWWRKGDAPSPVKANLGESSSFYYDAEQKRWVNKKAGNAGEAGNAEEAKPTTPPPPSRAQTASPAMTGPRPPGTGSGPPPNRPASAIDLSTSPPSRTTMRVRSNLAPTPDSAPSTPTGSRLAPPGPPPGRPKSQASKRNIRSRYVDVLQQEASA